VFVTLGELRFIALGSRERPERTMRFLGLFFGQVGFSMHAVQNLHPAFDSPA
jgi:hypothetical protein